MSLPGRYGGFEFEGDVPHDDVPQLDGYNQQGGSGRATDPSRHSFARRNERSTIPESAASSAGSGHYRLQQSIPPPPTSLRGLPLSNRRRDDAEYQRDDRSASPPRLPTSYQHSSTISDAPVNDRRRARSPLLPSLSSVLPDFLTRRRAPSEAHAASLQNTYNNPQPHRSARPRDSYDSDQVKALGIARFGVTVPAERSTGRLPLPPIQESYRAPDRYENGRIADPRPPVAAPAPLRSRERTMSLPAAPVAAASAMTGGTVIKGRGPVNWMGVPLLDVGQGNDGQWYCLEAGCSKSYSNLSVLRAHHKTRHFNGTPNHCTFDETCNAKFASSKQLKEHLKSHKISGRFQCGCGIPYKNKLDLENHLASSKSSECRPT